MKKQVFIKVNHRPNTKFNQLQKIATRKLKANYSFKEAESYGRSKTKEDGDKRVSYFQYLIKERRNNGLIKRQN